MSKQLKVLLIDDDSDFRELLKIILEEENYPVHIATNGKEGIDALKKNNYDVVLTDLLMKSVNGLDVLEYIQANKSSIETIIITAHASVETAVEAMKKGAFSYFIKSNNPEELIFELEKIGKINKLSHENEILKEVINKEEYLMQSKSSAYRSVLEYSKKVAETDSNVLILGESGVGKEVLARYIHKHSLRKREVFIPVNCYSFSDTLLESELYGFEKGSFTGATERRKGRFEAADHGTLFLDEIGDLPLSTQIKILRNIEEKQIERIGSNEIIDLDFRLITATNKDLDLAIKNGVFREDLYYRISTVIIKVPPLRERKEDIPDLINLFLKKAQKSMKKRVTEMDKRLHDALVNYHYPGNIRELKNIIERLIVLSEDGRVSYEMIEKHGILNKFSEVSNNQSLKEARKEAERAYILEVLKKTDYGMDQASDILEISTRQLYNKVKEYNITLK